MIGWIGGGLICRDIQLSTSYHGLRGPRIGVRSKSEGSWLDSGVECIVGRDGDIRWDDVLMAEGRDLLLYELTAGVLGAHQRPTQQDVGCFQEKKKTLLEYVKCQREGAKLQGSPLRSWR